MFKFTKETKMKKLLKLFKAKHKEATNRWRKNKKYRNKENNTPNECKTYTINEYADPQKNNEKSKQGFTTNPTKKECVKRATATSMDLLKQESRKLVVLDSNYIQIIRICHGQEDVFVFMPGKQDVFTNWINIGN